MITPSGGSPTKSLGRTPFLETVDKVKRIVFTATDYRERDF